MRERGPAPTIQTHHICWDRKLPRQKEKNGNQIFKLKRIGGRRQRKRLGLELLALREEGRGCLEEGIARAKGPDWEKQEAGDRDSWTVEGSRWGPGLSSSLTLFLELSNVFDKDILLQAQHPEQLLHQELTWEEG